MKLFKPLFFILLFGIISCSNQPQHNTKTSPKGREAYELERLADPATGKIPEGIRMRELAFASTLPKTYSLKGNKSAQVFVPIGPRNVGGRTRAVSFDVDSSNVVLAGGVSGGMWRSRDFGVSWKRVTNFEDHSAVSCMIQDTRPGNTHIFYYGSGENRGNSASKSFSANYLGSGIYKSTDHGMTWTLLSSTSVLPHKGGDFKYVFRVSIDPTRMDSDIVYAATPQGIRRSADGGANWELVLGDLTYDYTDIVITSDGSHYAAFSSDGSKQGFWRSEDGLNWVNISPPQLPSKHDRTLMAIAPSNPNVVYFYTVTPGQGNSEVMFWKYTYLFGDGSGSGGNWENRTQNLPPVNGYSLNTQGSYCMSLAVKPDNENVVFLGGTNLFRSNNAFSNSSGMRQLGGYDADGYAYFDYYKDNQHPDQQSLAFVPNNPNQLLAGTDGGIHFTTNCMASKVIWSSFNNGYQTSQFYAIGIDHGSNNEHVISGYQDNGSWWAPTSDTNTNWKHVNGGDGAYCAVEDGGTNVYYVSSQYGYIHRIKVNANGDVTSSKSVPPSGTSGYLFNHPFILDPSNNNRMYLPNGNDVWRNNNLAALDVNQKDWTKIAEVGTSSSTITAIAASTNVQGTVYVGTRSKRIYKVVDSGSNSAVVTDITNGITSGGYTSNIAIDPKDEDRAIVVFSNYNIISAWLTEDGGNTWSDIEGNLKGNPDPGVPPNLEHLGDGPSFRWAKFIHTPEGELVLMGTSIGLFATKDITANPVVWVQQASDVIGNVVIEQIDYRESDGFCVIATHGAGAYKTYFNNNWDITSVSNVEIDKHNVFVYPNPVSNILYVSYELDQVQTVRLDILNTNGQIIHTQWVNSIIGENIQTVDLSEYSRGVYYINITSKSGVYTKTVVKN